MGWLLGLHPAHRQRLQRTPLALALRPRLSWWLSGFGSGQRPELQAQRRGLGEQDHPGAQAPEPDSQTHLCSPGLAPLSAVGFVPGSGPRGRAETLLEAWTPESNHACRHTPVDAPGKADLLGTRNPNGPERYSVAALLLVSGAGGFWDESASPEQGRTLPRPGRPRAGMLCP